MTPEKLIKEFAETIRGTEHEPYFREMERRNLFIIGRALRDFPGGRALDVGASPGHLSALLKNAGCDVTAVDLFPDEPFMSDMGVPRKNLFRDLGIRVLRHDIAAGALPVESGAFDIALFNEVLEHLQGNPVPVIAEIARALRPGGRLYLTTPNVTAVRNRFVMLMGGNIHTPVEVVVNVAPYKIHHREYTLREAADVVKRAGLRVAEAGHYFFRNPPAGKPLDALLTAAFAAATALWPSLRSNLFVVGEKK